MIAVRPVERDDDEFLCRVYRSTREAELALVDWDEDQKQAFVRMQFEAQTQYYEEHYTGTSYDVILVDGEPAGRLWVARSPAKIRVMDIALLPPFRGRGIGTGLLQGLLDEAGQAGIPVTVHVEVFNPARRLYERLGFRCVSEQGVYLRLEWRQTATRG